MEDRELKKISYVLSLLEVSIQSIVFYGLIVLFYSGILKLGINADIIGFWVVACVVISFITRKFIKSFFPFILVHIGLFGIGFYFAPTADCIVFNFFVVLILTMFSIKTKNSVAYFNPNSEDLDDLVKEDVVSMTKVMLFKGEHLGIGFLAVLAVGYLVGSNNKDNVLMGIELILILLMVALQIIYNNMSRLQQVFLIHGKKTEFPSEQLKKVNMLITTTSVVLILLGIMIFYSGPFGSFLGIVGNALMIVVRFFGKCLLALMYITSLGNSSSGPVEEETPSETETATEEFMENNIVMESVFEAFAFALIVAIFIAIAYYLLKYIKGFSLKIKENGDIIENIKGETKKERVPVTQRLYERFFDKDNNNIRKIYKSMVKKGAKGEKPDATNTPIELTLDYITEDKSKAEEITNMYEKARYSQEKISQEDIKTFKRFP